MEVWSLAKVLVVDDESSIVELISYNLEREGFSVITAGDGGTAVTLARQEQPDLIILDVMLPVRDGLSVCRILQQDPATRRIPIIMLSARGEELDKVLGLELGADDYITKPFSLRELLARIRARLRRESMESEDIVQPEKAKLARGPLLIDQDRFAVTLNNKRLDFTPKEFELLLILAARPGRVFTRDQLLQHIWGYDHAGDTRIVDVHIRHIRQKLEQAPGAPQLIETVRGVGYRFKETT
jgi:two-component system alkaline phosphatase synthesis response regulator PhoP